MRGLAYLLVAAIGFSGGWTGGVAVGPLAQFDGARAALHGWLYGDPPRPPALSIDTVSPSPAPVTARPAPGAPTARKTHPPTPGAAPARTAPPRSRDGDAAPAAPLAPLPIATRVVPPIRPPPSARVRATGGPEKDQTTDDPTPSASPITTTPTPITTSDPPITTSAAAETSAADTPEPTMSEVAHRCPTPRHRHCSRPS